MVVADFFRRLRTRALLLLAVGGQLACGGGSSRTESPVLPQPLVLSIARQSDLRFGAPTEQGSGMPILFSFVLRNDGPFDARDLPVRLELGANLGLVDIACSVSELGGGVCPDATGQVMDIPLLPLRSRMVFTVTAIEQVPASFVATATMAFSAPGDTDPLDDAATASLQIWRADLDVRIVAPAQAAAGSVVRFDVIVTNKGPDDAPSLGLGFPQLSFPVGVQVVRLGCQVQQGQCSYGGYGLGGSTRIDAGSTSVFAWDVTLPAAGMGSVTASADLTNGADPDQADNVATATVAITAP